MRAITVQNPWAWAILHGKNIENRSQRVNYRGPLLIHAGLRSSERGWSDPRVRQAWQDAGGLALPFGALIAVCDLVDCHPAAECCKPWGDDEYDGKRVHHLVLEAVRPLPEPIPCTGRLGLWTPPADVLSQIPLTGEAS